ncbi:Cyclic nucleotide-gated ion channel 1 [Linum perenne]
MNYPHEKLVRYEWRPEKVSGSDYEHPGKVRTKISSFSNNFKRRLGSGSERFSKIRKSLTSSYSFGESSNGGSSSRNCNILDPQGAFLQRWNKIFVLSCFLAVSLDPLFFYVPLIDPENSCLKLDNKMQITASVLRSFTDVFYVLHIVFKFRTGFIAPSSRVFGRGVLVQDSWEIAKRYIASYFLVDVLALLPLPQMVILIITPRLQGSRTLNTKNLLKFVVIFQYLPRIIRIYPLYSEVTRTSGILTETAWAGAAFNLFLYMLASHVLGAFWYLFSIERLTVCWKKACDAISCDRDMLYCDGPGGNKTFLNTSCPINPENTDVFNFGIFHDALQSGIVATHDFPEKFSYCFWWGLRNLSSLGQNLATSTFVWEICFSVAISIFGLVLFSFLIGNMQTFLQSTTTRLEEMRVKRRDAEQWMSHRMLPDNLRRRIRRHEQYKWQETRGVDELNLVHNLPKDIRRDIKRHLCLALLMRVPMFEKMDDQLLDAMCDRLRPTLYTEESYIVREGDPVDEMLFIMRGKLLTITTNGGRTGFFNSEKLKAGDFCGEELLTWALDPHTSSNLPISTRTVRTITEVEGFVLTAEDLKFVASQFRRLNSKQIRHTFRFYSQQWRTWAACFIQAAWRRYSKKKLEESLKQEEDRLQDALAKEEDRLQDALAKASANSAPSIGATIYASRFAANALRLLRRNSTRKARVSERLPPLLLQKPTEPDFTADERS